MKALGFRADPNMICWAAVEGSGDSPKLLDSGKLPAPKSYDEATRLGWYRTQVRTLIDQYKPDKIAVRYPEPSARQSAPASTHRRVRIEGVILEAASSKAIPALTGALVTMKAQLKTDSARTYLDTGEFRGLDLSKIKDNRREAALVAVAALGTSDAESSED